VHGCPLANGIIYDEENDVQRKSSARPMGKIDKINTHKNLTAYA